MFGLILLAVVSFAKPFSDGAVLQRDAKVAVWGTAAAGERVKVEFAGQTHETVADGAGKWRVDLDPMPACKEGRDLSVSAQSNNQTISNQTIHDVLVGEVWFVSGQSNAVCPFWCDIATRFRTITTGGLMVQYVDKPTVRFTDDPGTWKRMNRANLVKTTAIEKESNACAGSFSALGTFFALKLEDVLDVPVGMIGEYVNGSPIEPWIAPDGNYWKGKISRWAPYTIRGVLWNQGDSNIRNAYEYDVLMKRLYDGWCAAFEHPGMSLYFMEQSHGTSDCFHLQLAQQRFAASEPHAAICAGNDLPNMAGDWHGNDKEPMARRMLVHALKRDYGFADIEDESPVFSHVIGVESNAVTLAFDHATGFYIYNAGMTDYRVPFEVCGPDGVWKPARLVYTPQKNWASQGLILSSNLTVCASEVATPRRVRYLRSGKGNVYSQVCLPLLAFEAEVSDGSGDTCVISNANGRAEIALRGGRLVSWRDRDGRELLFMPEKKITPGGDWSHGGIPVCWPWFGRKDGVIHGFIRNKYLSVRRRTADSVTLGLALSAGEERTFPQAADLELTLTLGKGLTFAMRTTNTGKDPFTYTEGLHPYFLVDDCRKVTFSGVDEQPFACVDGMDKGFARSADGTFSFTDPARGVAVRARATGNSHVIVWTPGTVEPANRNLAPEDTVRFLGYGPAFTKAAGSITLKPGETHELTLQLETAEK